MDQKPANIHQTNIQHLIEQPSIIYQKNIFNKQTLIKCDVQNNKNKLALKSQIGLSSKLYALIMFKIKKI